MDLTENPAYCGAYAPPNAGLRKMLRIMKLTAIILLAACLQVSAKSNAQTVSLSVKDAPLERVFQAIEKQTGYLFWYNSALIQKAKNISIELKDVTLELALQACFKDQPLTFTIVNKTIVVKQKTPEQVNKTPSPLPIDVKGQVVNEVGEPVPGVTVLIKGTGIGTSTDANGNFLLTGIISENAILVFSSTNIEPYELNLEGKTEFIVHVKTRVSKLDEVQIIGYGQTTKRLSTGSVSKVTDEEINQQPVSNPLQALQGRVAGLYVRSTGGRPGTSINVQIRGQSSIAAGTTPLYVVDGVPFGAVSLDQLSAITGGINPFNTINPADIESVEVLKDADATAIYGSRGANGVVLITTRKGRAGKSTTEVTIKKGIGKVTRFMDLMDTKQYLEMRRMAFVNDGVTPTPANAPDLFVWDTTKTTDWQQYLLGGTADITEMNASLSGGDHKTRFYFSAGYRKETTVFPGDARDDRITSRLTIDHNSDNRKLYASFSINYTFDKNTLIPDVTQQINLPPNYPIYDSTGRFYWISGLTNPVSLQYRTPYNQTSNLIANAQFRYNLFNRLQFKASLGYTKTDLDQVQVFPQASKNPALNQLGSASFADRHTNTWIVEPQLVYTDRIGKGTIDVLAGLSLQESLLEGKVISATNYTDDKLLRNLGSAGNTTQRSNYSEYTYGSFFSRVSYKWEKKYVLNLNFRRDGSSRFGSGKQFGNFWAAGGAWIFSEESWVGTSKFLSFGKIRASYGVTGNDQITDYQYLASYVATPFAYQEPGLYPVRIANPEYSWESNKKAEVALELGFIKDRILLSSGYFNNRSSNQLVNYQLPGQTGFTGYQANLPATLQNSGWEITLNAANIQQTTFKWSTSFNLTLLKSKLISFPDLSGSSYGRNNLIIGEPLNLAWAYDYVGVDPQTGLTVVRDVNNNGVISSSDDFLPISTLLPKSYGGMGNTIEYKNFQLDIFIRFVKSIDRSVISQFSVPGTMSNQESRLSNLFWKKTGDNALLPRPSTSGAGVSSFNLYRNSNDGRFTDVSFLKLNNVMLAYNFPQRLVQQLKMQSIKVFVQGQNLITITDYTGLDPESIGTFGLNLPNLTMLTFGIHCKL